MAYERALGIRGPNGFWGQARMIGSQRSYRCGYCAADVASNVGFCTTRHNDGSGDANDRLLICPKCGKTTLFSMGESQQPLPLPGRSIRDISEAEVKELYEEARRSHAAGAFTAAVMCCRKLLMNIAVRKGADPGKRYVEYVDWLAANGFVPPDGKSWVDEIRQLGNQANHEISTKSQHDSEDAFAFVEALLSFVYELSARMTRRQARSP